MRPLLLLVALLATAACKNTRPGPFPGTPVAHTEVKTGAITPPEDEADSDCTTPTVERFPSLNDAAPFLAEQLPGVARDLEHTDETEQLVVAYLGFCSSGGPRVYVADVRDVAGTATAYLSVVSPDTAIDVHRRPYLIFTIPASYPELETVVDHRRR